MYFKKIGLKNIVECKTKFMQVKICNNLKCYKQLH